MNEFADRPSDAGGAVLLLELLRRGAYNDEVLVSDGLEQLTRGGTTAER